MRFCSLVPLAAVALAAGGSALAAQAQRVSGPHVHDNLAIYFVHGESAAGSVPLTLQEALARNSVQVVETGQVNELQIENSGSEPVFIQVGDIVKGGRQDRVLTASLLLPPQSGRVPIASFCVEQGRWSARGAEDQARFSSAREAMPSVEALLAIAAPRAADKASGETPAARPPGAEGFRPAGASDDIAGRQHKVWEEVKSTQRKLARELDTSVASPQSGSSLQLSLENAKLNAAREDFVKSLRAFGEADADIVGYVVAINGQVRAANVYPSNALFRKMWEKQLASAVTAAIGDKRELPASAPPAPPAVTEFLANAEKGQAYSRALAAGMRLETRDADTSLFNEARAADGKWIHRSYLAK
jgi:hypothetical protein